MLRGVGAGGAIRPPTRLGDAATFERGIRQSLKFTIAHTHDIVVLVANLVALLHATERRAAIEPS